MPTKQRGSYRGLRQYIVTILFVAAAIPFAVIGGSIYHQYRTSIRKNVTLQLTSMVTHHKESIERFLTEITAALMVTTDLVPCDKMETGALQNVFNSLQKEYGHAFEDMGVIDSKGDHLAYVGPYDLLGKNYSQAAWFKQVLEKNVFISDVFLGFRQVPHFIVAVKQGEGKCGWILRATVDAARFGSLVENVRLGRTGDAFIVTREGYYQTRARVGGGVMEKIEPGSINLSPFEGVKFWEVEDSKGHKVLRAKTWMKDNNWLLIVQQDVDEAFSELFATKNIAMVVFLLGVFLVAVVTFLTTRLLVRKIERADEEKKVLDEQLIQSAKLASIGEISAGIAHEINNPLAIMGEEAGWMQDLLKRDSLKDMTEMADFKDSLQEIAKQAGRCKEITHKLLSFARKMESVIKDVNVNELIDDVVDMVESEAALANIEIIRLYHEHLPLIYSDPSQLRQVLLNLINNALDAIKRGGEVKIETGIGEGDSIAMKVSDTGAGIARENLSKVFDPFFTTKPAGKGTGLGLSICHGIIEKLGGDISVTSEVGKGTTFTISLPLEQKRGE
ncbi:MAG: two-component sensor histidine kinase [Desulfobacterales bacterium]|nr:two-component sensor histidine kinase [Desulfobacterales bacterium]